jgi:hypothetical protein
LQNQQQKHTIGLREKRACISENYGCLTCNTIYTDAREYKTWLTFVQMRPCICCLAGGWMLCDLPPLITTVSNITVYNYITVVIKPARSHTDSHPAKQQLQVLI